jgi:hypothetical protein
MGIYEDMVKAGVEIGHHESDLYVEDSEAARAVLKDYPFRSNCKRFCCNITGEIWIDIPFAYEPFWDKVSAESARRAKRV